LEKRLTQTGHIAHVHRSAVHMESTRQVDWPSVDCPCAIIANPQAT
jgi:hypothetical protein